MASAANNSSTTASASQAQGVRHSVRQTRTNPSRTSKTVARSFNLYGQPSTTDAPQTPSVPHGFYPALTHFTDAITALPREFRRHNSLLKEVDAKAWALEENLQQLLTIAVDSEPVPCPPNPAPIVDGVIREYPMSQDAPRESQESKNRRLLFDRIRRTLSDLMMTADEKNHVITNANDELDHQLFRLDSIFPYISGEISEEARLGSLTHWAYTNRSNAKTSGSTANERPRREAASNNTAHLVQAIHEAEAASRSEARREAVLARKQRRNHAESDFDETRAGGARKGAVSKTQATTDAAVGAVSAGGPAKRRKVEKPQPVQGGAAMERSLSGVNSAGRATSKDAAGADAKKKARAPNAPSTAGRKRNNTVTSHAESPSAVSSPVVGTFNPPRNAPSPGPNAPSRPQSSRAQQTANQANSARQRPPSSASNRVNNSNKSTDSKANNTKEGSTKEATPQAASGDGNPNETEGANTDTKAVLATAKDDPPEEKIVDDYQAIETAAVAPAAGSSTAKGRSSKNLTPVVSTVGEPNPPRSRPSRNNNDSATAKRSHKKNGSLSAAQAAAAAATEDEESSREGDDEDDEGEPRYCYCNEISFGEMVACDNDACPREWFHLSCVGLTKPPGKNVKWYCNECKENMKRGRSNGGR
ncbi:hypothetical protein VTN77DRAFT_6754 [Rasamsonia byssochlamydoides]|uniref:uncharacterized protein n=1 Tax=Rasamsonia byssochlamydoides TaxID=89139 RepID=UPI003742FC12